MIRVNISQGSNSFGSLFVGDGTVELHTANRDRFLEALALAYTALTGRDCAKSLQNAPRGGLAPLDGKT